MINNPYPLDAFVTIEANSTVAPPLVPLRFREVYRLYFTDDYAAASPDWPSLKRWLDARGWGVRPHDPGPYALN